MSRPEPAPFLPPRSGRSALRGMELAPLVDVVMLVLLFTLITAAQTEGWAIPVDVPEVGEAEVSGPAHLLIGIAADGSITVNGEATTREGLVAQLPPGSAVPGSRAHFQVDREVRWGTVAWLYALCRQAGYRTLDFSVVLESAPK